MAQRRLGDGGSGVTAGRVALVTAAGSGICAAASRGLAESGQRLLLLDSDGEAAARLSAELGGALAADPLVVDATDAAAVEVALDALPPESKPDILVNGVGGDTRPIPFASLTEADLIGALSLNLMTAFTMTRLCVPTMIERGWGRIVNVASIAGRTYSHFSNAAYVAAKSGLIGLTKQCAYELAPHGICVNAVAHGPIATARVQQAFDARDENWRARLLDRVPAGRLGTVDEAAAAIIHLCGDSAGYTAGAAIDVNGGLYI
jgi:NAD(P)-dependent dehydrogenase (short-subunit alcohol dehydrogenase family)